MLKPDPQLTMPVEVLLVLMIILREGDRTEQFALLAERVYDWYRLDPDEREVLAAELQRYHTGIGSAASILALRALRTDERSVIASQILDFAAADPLLSPHQRRLAIRVHDILALDDPA